MTPENDRATTTPAAEGGAQERCVWAILRTDRLVLAVSDAEIALVRLPSGALPDWLPPVSGLIDQSETAPTIDAVAAAGTVRTRIPRAELAFAEVSGSVLMIQGLTDIPYVLAAHEAGVAEAVVARLSGPRVGAVLADVAKDIWKWNMGMLFLGVLAVVVPLFEASWGVAVIAAAVLGFGLRRPVCYLAYAVLCLGGAVASGVAHLHTPLGGWFGTIWLMLAVALIMGLRYRYFRHVQTTDAVAADPVPAWLGPMAMAIALAACLVSAAAVHLPGKSGDSMPGSWAETGDNRSMLPPDFPNAAAVIGETATRLPGHLGVLAMGLALGVWPSRRMRPWSVAAGLLGLLLLAALLVRSARNGPEPRIQPHDPLGTAEDGV